MTKLSTASRGTLSSVMAAAVAAVCVIAIIGDGDLTSVVSFVFRYAHVLAAMIWVGLIWYVNVVQLPALYESSDDEKRAILKRVVPGVALQFRVASHVTLATGIVLLWMAGHLTLALAGRGFVMWLGALGGVTMWVLVNHVIAPNLKVVLDDGSSAGAKLRARSKVALYARTNQLLAIVVLAVMLAVAHG